MAARERHMRNRPVDIEKPIPICRSQEEIDQQDEQAAYRVAPDVATGMEKEDEHELHIQQALAQTGFGYTGQKAKATIPTPKITEYPESLAPIPPGFSKSKEYVMYHEPTGSDNKYDMDDEDMAFLEELNDKYLQNEQSPTKKGKPILVPQRFEQLFDRFEKETGFEDSPPPFESMKRADKDKMIPVLEEVYNYWMDKRSRAGNTLLLMFQKLPVYNDPDIRKPFRPRDKRSRKNDYDRYLKIRESKRLLEDIDEVLKVHRSAEDKRRKELMTVRDSIENERKARNLTTAMDEKKIPTVTSALANVVLSEVSDAGERERDRERELKPPAKKHRAWEMSDAPGTSLPFIASRLAIGPQAFGSDITVSADRRREGSRSPSPVPRSEQQRQPHPLLPLFTTNCCITDPEDSIIYALPLETVSHVKSAPGARSTVRSEHLIKLIGSDPPARKARLYEGSWNQLYENDLITPIAKADEFYKRHPEFVINKSQNHGPADPTPVQPVVPAPGTPAGPLGVNASATAAGPGSTISAPTRQNHQTVPIGGFNFPQTRPPPIVIPLQTAPVFTNGKMLPNEIVKHNMRGRARIGRGGRVMFDRYQYHGGGDDDTISTETVPCDFPDDDGWNECDISQILGVTA